MEKRKIAIVCGGFSSERQISLQSAEGLYGFIDTSKYQVWIVVIEREAWYVRLTDGRQAAIDKNDFGFIDGNKFIRFDFAWITIHGTPGEDGVLQGYFDLVGIPYSNCGVLASALTFNKFACNQYLKGFGVKVAESLLLRKGQTVTADQVVSLLGLPCFVKSNVGGSSFGTTKVKQEEEVLPAIERAFREGDEVIVEKFLDGKEFTCGCYKTRQGFRLLPVTEVLPKNEFFDYNAKYEGNVQEITPARISKAFSDQFHQITSMIYDIIGCKGIIRVDYIVTNEGIHLLEVNTTPGMTKTSFIPQQVAAAGLSMGEVMEEIIEEAFE